MTNSFSRLKLKLKKGTCSQVPLSDDLETKGILMYKLFKISILLILTFASVNGCATVRNKEIHKKEALDAAVGWFKYLDEKNYEKLWEISSDLRKLKTDKQHFLRVVRGIREPLGRVKNRDLQVNDATVLVRHYPDGEYWKIIYWSKYENKNFVREYFLLIKEGGNWKVLEYNFL